MKLITAPYNTCGDLLCEVANKSYSSISNGNYHNSVDPIRGSVNTYNSIDLKINRDDLSAYNIFPRMIYEGFKDRKDWIGTQYYPAIKFPIMEKATLHVHPKFFKKIVAVTVTTDMSKIYRFSRIKYHHYNSFTKERPRKTEKFEHWLETTHAIEGSNIFNIEFSDFVENKMIRELIDFLEITDIQYYNERRFGWIKENSFLLDKDYINQISKEYEMTIKCKEWSEGYH